MMVMIIAIQTLIIAVLLCVVLYQRQMCNLKRKTCDKESPKEFYIGRHRRQHEVGTA